MVERRAERPGRQFFLDSERSGPINLIGDGLLPADIDGKQKPKTDAAIPIVGTQDDGGAYGATFDALNIWDLVREVALDPGGVARASKTQLPTARVRLDLPVRPTPATACRSRASPTRTSTSTSSPTGSGRPGGSPTGTSRTTRRW